MDNILFVCRRNISSDEYAGVVSGLGGTIDADSPGHATIESTSDVVFTRLYDRVAEEFDPDELADLSARLGQQPRSGIDVQISHRAGSRELAARIGRTFIGRWGGVIEAG